MPTCLLYLGGAKNIRAQVINEEFQLRKQNYDLLRERESELHKLIKEEKEWVIKIAKENYLKAQIERRIAEIKKEQAELELNVKKNTT